MIQNTQAYDSSTLLEDCSDSEPFAVRFFLERFFFFFFFDFLLETWHSNRRRIRKRTARQQREGRTSASSSISDTSPWPSSGFLSKCSFTLNTYGNRWAEDRSTTRGANIDSLVVGEHIHHPHWYVSTWIGLYNICQVTFSSTNGSNDISTF